MPLSPLPAVIGPYREDNSDITRLLMERGRIGAEAEARRGDILAGTVAGLGQQIGGAIQQRAAAQQETVRQKAFEAAVASGDPQQIIKVMGPRDGPAVVNALRAMQPDGMKQYKDRMELLRDVARGVLAAPKESRPQAYAFARNSLLQSGAVKPEEAPEQFDEGFVGQLAAYGMQPAAPKAAEGFTLGPGQQRFGPDGLPIASVAPTPPKPPEPPAVGSFEDFVLREAGPNPSGAQIEHLRRRYAAADNRPPREGLTPTMEANVINRLTTQWGKAVEPVREISRQVKLMDVGLEAARKGDLAQGAQMVLVTFQKILDPPSVVRESEYMRSAAGLALLDRVRGAAERLVKGGAGVPVEQLEKFAALARQAAKAQSSGYVDAVKVRLGKTADRWNIPQDLIFEDYDFGAALEPPGAAPAGVPKPTAAPQRGERRMIKGQPAEWDGKGWVAVR